MINYSLYKYQVFEEGTMPVKTKNKVANKVSKMVQKKTKNTKKDEDMELDEIELEEDGVEADADEEIIKEITPKKKVVVQKPKMADIDDFLNSLEEERGSDY